MSIANCPSSMSAKLDELICGAHVDGVELNHFVMELTRIQD